MGRDDEEKDDEEKGEDEQNDLVTKVNQLHLHVSSERHGQVKRTTKAHVPVIITYKGLGHQISHLEVLPRRLHDGELLCAGRVFRPCAESQSQSSQSRERESEGKYETSRNLFMFSFCDPEKLRGLLRNIGTRVSLCL